MDSRLFNLLEILFIGALLIAVMYFGGLFGKEANSVPSPAQPTALPARATVTVQKSTPVPAPRPSRTVAPASSPGTYQIASGDTCTAIAIKFDISLQRLIALNKLDAECRILAGDSLKIPVPTPTIAP